MERQYVGIDLHRRRSVIYRMDAAGEKLECVRVDNEPMRFAEEVAKAPAGSEVVIEATYGWYWAVDLLEEMGYAVHLAHPRGNDWGKRRVKNDERDARDLADLLRLGRLAEAWIASPEVRELRELVRFRAKLSNLRTGLKAQLHAVLAKNGVLPCRGDMWGIGGAAQLDALELPAAYTNRIETLRDLVTMYDREITFSRSRHSPAAPRRPGYEAVQAIYGVGRVFAAVFVAEIGDVHRFASAQALCSWAGLTPTHRESDTKVDPRTSPNKDPSWCVGLRSKPSLVITAASISIVRSARSPSGAARRKPKSPSPAKFSRSSTTACATARSAVCAAGRRRDARCATERELDYRQDSHPGGAVDEVIEPARPRPDPHHARTRRRRHASAAEPAHPHHPQLRETWCDTSGPNDRNQTEPRLDDNDVDVIPTRAEPVQPHRRTRQSPLDRPHSFRHAVMGYRYGRGNAGRRLSRAVMFRPSEPSASAWPRVALATRVARTCREPDTPRPHEASSRRAAWDRWCSHVHRGVSVNRGHSAKSLRADGGAPCSRRPSLRHGPGWGRRAYVTSPSTPSCCAATTCSSSSSSTRAACTSPASLLTRPAPGPPKPHATSPWDTHARSGSSIRDGAGQFVAGFDSVFRSDGAKIIRTPPYTPVANAYAERWIGTVRRELLDRTLVWNRGQLDQLLRDYVEHYNTHRPHRSLEQRAPDDAELVEYRYGQPIRRHPTCAALINEYRQAA